MTDDALYRYRMDESRKWRERGEECAILPADHVIGKLPEGSRF